MRMHVYMRMESFTDLESAQMCLLNDNNRAFFGAGSLECFHLTDLSRSQLPSSSSSYCRQRKTTDTTRLLTLLTTRTQVRSYLPRLYTTSSTSISSISISSSSSCPLLLLLLLFLLLLLLLHLLLFLFLSTQYTRPSVRQSVCFAYSCSLKQEVLLRSFKICF